MALLKLNGVDVECTASEREPVRLGGVVRGLNGQPRKTDKVRKVDFRFTSSLLSLAEADALRGLVDGEGHALSFDASLYTSRCAPPGNVAAGTVVLGAGRHGAGHLRVPVAGAVTWALELPAEWTVLLWRLEAGAWRHYCVTSTGRRWRDGVRDDTLAAAAFVSVVGGQLQLGDLSGAGFRDFDDAVALPYLVPDAWVPQLHAFHTSRPWPALPYLVAEGPRLPAGGLRVVGEAGAAPAVARLSSVGERVPFTLYGT